MRQHAVDPLGLVEHPLRELAVEPAPEILPELLVLGPEVGVHDVGFVALQGLDHGGEIGRVVLQVLEAASPSIDTHTYFAWDPLASAALLDSSLVTARQGSIEVVTGGKNIGRTKLVRWNSGSTLSIALDANAARFQTVFERTFAK